MCSLADGIKLIKALRNQNDGHFSQHSVAKSVVCVVLKDLFGGGGDGEGLFRGAGEQFFLCGLSPDVKPEGTDPLPIPTLVEDARKQAEGGFPGGHKDPLHGIFDEGVDPLRVVGGDARRRDAGVHDGETCLVFFLEKLIEGEHEIPFGIAVDLGGGNVFFEVHVRRIGV